MTKNGIYWWTVENQNLYRDDAIRRMSQMTHGERSSSPAAGLHSPLWLLVHLAEIERYYLDILAGRRSDRPMYTVPSDRPEPSPWPDWDTLLGFVRQTRDKWVARLRELDDRGLARRYGREPYLTGGWIVAHVFEHESFHMGQLRWALRMLEK